MHDPDGDQATFERIQWMRFLQDDVLAVLDHFWGDGEIRAAYDVRHGLVTETFRDQGRRHVVIALPGPMGRGEMAPLWVHRRVEGGFTGSDEWVETMIDHPTRQLQRQVIFPKERPCRKAMVQIEDRTLDLRIRNAGEGRTMVSFEAQKVGVNTPYTIRWQW